MSFWDGMKLWEKMLLVRIPRRVWFSNLHTYNHACTNIYFPQVLAVAMVFICPLKHSGSMLTSHT